MEFCLTMKVQRNTRKIIRALCKIKIINKKYYILRCRGHAKDYVRAMWLMMQKNKPDDYVISTGKQYSVKNFIDISSKKIGLKIKWKKKGKYQEAINLLNNKIIVKQSLKYFRVSEVDSLLGDSTKAKKKLNWKPKHDLNSLIDEMIREELKNLN